MSRVREVMVLLALLTGCTPTRTRRVRPPPVPPPTRVITTLNQRIKTSDGKFAIFALQSHNPVGAGVVIDGKPVPPHTALFGFLDASGRELAPVEFTAYEVPNSEVVFGRRWSDKRLTRVQLDGGEPPQVTDVTEIVGVTTNDRPNYYGLIREQHQQQPTVVVFDDDWHEAFRLTDVAKMEVPAAYQHVSFLLEHQAWPIERLAGGDVLAHHRSPDGKRFSVVYDVAGNPTGPALPQVFRIPTGETTRQYVFPTAGGLFWPLNHLGTPESLSGEIVGMIPLISRAQWYLNYLDRLEGWAVKAQTAAGVRWAIVKDLSALHGPLPVAEFEYEEVHVPDESPIKWSTFHVSLRDPWVVLRRPGETTFELHGWRSKTGGLMRWMSERTFTRPEEVWTWAVETSKGRQVVFQAQLNEQRAAQALERQRQAAAARAAKVALFAKYQGAHFVASESHRLAVELGAQYFARWCALRPDQCTSLGEIELALSRMDPRTNEYTALRQHLDRIAPPPPPRRRGFRVGDLVGTGAPTDRSFDNYRRGWQNWYYKDGQLVVKPK